MAKTPSVPSRSVHIMFMYEAGEKMPTEVPLSGCSLDYFDSKPTAKLLTGVHGARSKQQALEALAAWNARRLAAVDQRAKGVKPAKLLMVDVVYTLVDEGDDSIAVGEGGQAELEASMETIDSMRWINLGTLTPALREVAADYWLSQIKRISGSDRAEQLKGVPLSRLVLEYPQVVPSLFKRNPGLLGVQHTVRARFASATPLSVATVRFDPQRITSAQVRYLPIPVKVS